MIVDLILQGNFAAARANIKASSFSEVFESEILPTAFDNASVTFYGFLFSMIVQEESAELHYFASRLMSTALCHLPGGYQTGFYHMKRAIELEPDDIGFKKDMLLYHDIPETLLSHDEARAIAQEILKADSSHKIAQAIVNL